MHLSGVLAANHCSTLHTLLIQAQETLILHWHNPLSAVVMLFGKPKNKAEANYLGEGMRRSRSLEIVSHHLWESQAYFLL